jgi:predicted nucleic acid-binding protein
MVVGLLDSAVLIDVLRGYAPAETWLKAQGQLGTTRIVWLEIIEGAPNKIKQRQALQLLRRFTVINLTPQDTQWAVRQLIKFNLNHNVDAFDCLIASVHPRLNIPLYTRNMKHFTPLIGSLAVRPY